MSYLDLEKRKQIKFTHIIARIIEDVQQAVNSENDFSHHITDYPEQEAALIVARASYSDTRHSHNECGYEAFWFDDVARFLGDLNGAERNAHLLALIENAPVDFKESFIMNLPALTEDPRFEDIKWRPVFAALTQEGSHKFTSEHFNWRRVKDELPSMILKSILNDALQRFDCSLALYKPAELFGYKGRMYQTRTCKPADLQLN